MSAVARSFHLGCWWKTRKILTKKPPTTSVKTRCCRIWPERRRCASQECVLIWEVLCLYHEFHDDRRFPINERATRCHLFLRGVGTKLKTPVILLRFRNGNTPNYGARVIFLTPYCASSYKLFCVPFFDSVMYISLTCTAYVSQPAFFSSRTCLWGVTRDFAREYINARNPFRRSGRIHPRVIT